MNMSWQMRCPLLPFAPLRGGVAIRPLSEQSGHPASRIDRIYESRASDLVLALDAVFAHHGAPDTGLLEFELAQTVGWGEQQAHLLAFSELPGGFVLAQAFDQRRSEAVDDFFRGLGGGVGAPPRIGLGLVTAFANRRHIGMAGEPLRSGLEHGTQPAGRDMRRQQGG